MTGKPTGHLHLVDPSQPAPGPLDSNAHFEQTPLAVVEMDLKHRVTRWNPAAERLFGFSRAEMIGQACEEVLVPGDERGLVEGILRETLTHGTTHRQVNRNRTKDGRLNRCEWYNTPLVDSAGRPVGLASMARDVTGDIDAELRLRTAEARYRGIFESAVWGILQTTLDGRYLDANPALAQIYGYSSPAELLENLTDIGRQLYVETDRRAEFVRQMRDNGSVSAFESEIFRRDGSRIWISESCRIVRTPDGQEFFQGTVEDITRRKEVERALVEEKERAESASRAKSTFLANMSHELRTPLDAIIGFSEILVGEMFGPLGHAKYREYAGDIMTSGGHLLQLINDILDMAKIEAGRMTPVPQPLHLGDVIEGAARMIRHRADEASLILRREVAQPLPRVMADPRAMKQILLNLLSNSVKFTPASGTITVSAARDGDEIVLAVSDTGIGMTADQLPVAMEPFQQIENTFQRRFEGTGLGLALVRSLAELQGLRFAIVSEAGKGTRASITFPAALAVREPG
jgi:PAS domain S-box-containing protein